MKRTKEEAIETPMPGDMWRKGKNKRLIVHEFVPTRLKHRQWVALITLSGRLDPRPTINQFRRWAKSAELIGGEW